MDVLMEKLDLLCAGLGGVLGWFFGGFDGFFYALTAFTAVDYVTGVMAAWVRKELSSSVGFRGILKKVTIFGVVGIVHVLDSQFLGHGEVLRDAVIFYFLANEGVSIAENAEAIGVPFPEFVKEKLAQIQDKDKGKGKETEK